MELATRADTTADYPKLLAGITNKILRQAYTEIEPTWKPFCRITDAKDFKDIKPIAFSEFDDLSIVPEHSELRYGDFSDAKETYRVYTYGKIWAVTRQALINDDLGAFSSYPRAFGASAARVVSNAVYAILNTNGNMPDAVALFHATHGNLGAAGVPSETTLTEARKLMGLQKGPKGAILNIVPRYVIAPVALETTIDKLLYSTGSLEDNKSAGVINAFAGKLIPIYEPRLDVASASVFYLAADPLTIDTIQVSFLNGREAPIIEERAGWTQLGMEFRAVLDLGCGVLDHRGLVKMPG